MSDVGQVSAAVPPHVQLIEMATACWISRIVCTAAKLGLADHLAAGPKSASELAGAMQVHAPSLHRFTRSLASLGLLTEHKEQRFGLMVLGEAMKTGAPGAARATLLIVGSTWLERGFENIVHSIQTGQDREGPLDPGFPYPPWCGGSSAPQARFDMPPMLLIRADEQNVTGRWWPSGAFLVRADIASSRALFVRLSPAAKIPFQIRYSKRAKVPAEST